MKMLMFYLSSIFLFGCASNSLNPTQSDFQKIVVTKTVDGKTKDIEKTRVNCLGGSLSELDELRKRSAQEAVERCKSGQTTQSCSVVRSSTATYSFSSTWSFYVTEWPYQCELKTTFEYPTQRKTN